MSDSIDNIRELHLLTKKVLNDKDFLKELDASIECLIKAYKNGKKTIFCGNGGSSAEAQHLAAELSGKFNFERDPIPSEACHVNSSFVTAVSNDYNFKEVYSRYIQGFGEKGDVLIGLSTSGTSENIVKAFETAKKKGLKTIALSGESGGNLPPLCDHILKVPSDCVPRIQEMHLLIGHIMCEKVEQALFENDQ